jgi:hypothetical protein
MKPSAELSPAALYMKKIAQQVILLTMFLSIHQLDK